MTAFAPAVWGTSYFVTTEFLPDDRPLLAATLRALPAGLLILAITRQLPVGSWWWKSVVLGTLNIGLFFACLFVAAYRLPGGVAATVGAIQPLIVMVMASHLLGEAITTRKVVAGAAGILGVALLLLKGHAGLEMLGVFAALGGAASMATGVVLAKKWGRPALPLVTTSWQLIAGGLVLLPVTLILEGLPSQPLNTENVLGYTYLALFGTAFAYTTWFRGIQKLPVTSVAFLGLISPIVAVLCGWALLHEPLSLGQFVGAAIVLGAILTTTLPPPARPGLLAANAQRDVPEFARQPQKKL